MRSVSDASAELARRLRQQQAGRWPLRLVALTGYGQAADRLRSQAAGFDDHLVKPVDIDRLDALLSEPALAPSESDSSPAVH